MTRPIDTSRLLATRLAAAAREVRDRVDAALVHERGRGPFGARLRAFQAELAHELDAAGFADMYAQTLAYGLLAARLADPARGAGAELAAHLRTSPVLRALWTSAIDEVDVRALTALLDRTDLAAVVREFAGQHPGEDPVVHFYELFLGEYDAHRRARRGVYYSPRAVVDSIVGSIDALLREEFGLALGLADITTWAEMAARRPGLQIPAGVAAGQAFVQILDPACGTGNFLLAVVDRIHSTMVETWRLQGHDTAQIGALWGEYVPRHLLTRLHGYELMAPAHVVAHLKLGIKLGETGYRFTGDERVGVHLTDALEPGEAPALAHEARAAQALKRARRFTVVLGNPPYAGVSANAGPWIEAQMERYKTTVRAQERQIQRLSNDYVKFMCLAQWLISRTGTGVVGFVTDRGWLAGILFKDMRAAIAGCFERVRVLDLRGAALRGARDDGDQNVFDIGQGVAISLLVRAPWRARRTIEYAALVGSRAEKYAALASGSCDWSELRPGAPGCRLVPTAEDGAYAAWPALTEVLGTGVARDDRDRRYGTGIKTRHDEFVIGWDAADAVRRVERVAFRSESDEQLVASLRLCTTAHFSIAAARERAAAGDLGRFVREIAFRPFDARALVYLREFVCEPKLETMRHMCAPGNLAMAVLRRDRRELGTGFFVARGLIAKDLVSNRDDALVWPLYVLEGDSKVANLAPEFVRRICGALGWTWQAQGAGDLAGRLGPEDVFAYFYAVFHAPGYRARFADLLRDEFPRVPLPGSAGLLRDLVVLGRALVAAHLLESSALDDHGVEYRGGELPVVGRVGWSDDVVWLDRAGRGAGFSGVTADVWGFHVGGYRVCEKWLRDRRGRRLGDGDIAHYRRMVAAVAATLRWMPAIDEVIARHGGWSRAFGVSESSGAG